MARPGMWRYVVPSLLTCTSMMVGFFSIAESAAGRPQSAAWLILLCVLLDKADGTAARLLKASSRFGLELDSLSDLITFGVAPAVLVVTTLADPPPWGLAQAIPHYGTLVYASAAFYLVAAALRLAKFNVLTDVYGGRHFFGIPTTVVAAIVCAYLLTVKKYQLPSLLLQALPLLLLLLGVLMVSRIPLRKVGTRKSVAFNIFMFTNVAGIYICGIFRLFPEYLLAVAVGYVVIGGICATAGGVRPPRALEALEAGGTGTTPDSSTEPSVTTAESATPGA